MAKQPNFDDARRQLDEALDSLAGSAATAPAPSEQAPESERPEGGALPPVPTTEALTRLLVGSAVLLLDELAARVGAWERTAQITRGAPIGDESTPGAARFRHGLIGWAFETEEELRPQGNPLQWLRGVAGHLSGSVFSMVFDALPRLGPLPPRPDPGEQETARWVARGQLEEQRSRAFARAALDDTLSQALPALARHPGMQQAAVELMRAPAMQQALAELARSPAMDDAVRAIVRSPAMEDAVTYLVNTQAMSAAIETLAHSPALVELVQTQSTSVASAALEEVREYAVSADSFVEGLTRRLLRRPPRSQLPPASREIMVRATRRP